MHRSCSAPVVGRGPQLLVGDIFAANDLAYEPPPDEPLCGGTQQSREMESYVQEVQREAADLPPFSQISQPAPESEYNIEPLSLLGPIRGSLFDIFPTDRSYALLAESVKKAGPLRQFLGMALGMA